MYNIQMLAQFATKLLGVEMSRVQAAYEKEDSQLLSNSGNADAALKTMKGLEWATKNYAPKSPPFLTL